jgi:hypothetical protein
MNWLLRHVLALWLLLTVTFVAALLVARLNRTPDALQVVGFDVWDGEPCFSGIKLGMDLEKARRMVPEANIEHEIYLQVPIERKGVQAITMSALRDEKLINGISMIYSTDGLYPFTAGEVIARFGPPCRLVLQSEEDKAQTAVLIYPSLKVFVTIYPYRQHDYRLLLNSPIDLFMIETQLDDICKTTDTIIHPWQGFRASRIYELRSCRESEASCRAYGIIRP